MIYYVGVETMGVEKTFKILHLHTKKWHWRVNLIFLETIRVPEITWYDWTQCTPRVSITNRFRSSIMSFLWQKKIRQMALTFCTFSLWFVNFFGLVEKKNRAKASSSKIRYPTHACDDKKVVILHTQRTCFSMFSIHFY